MGFNSGFKVLIITVCTMELSGCGDECRRTANF